MNIRNASLLLALILALGLNTVIARTGNELTKKATWSQPTPDEVKAKLEKWLADIKADDATKQKALAAWDSTASDSNTDLTLERVAAALAAVDQQAAEVVNASRD